MDAGIAKVKDGLRPKRCTPAVMQRLALPGRVQPLRLAGHAEQALADDVPHRAVCHVAGSGGGDQVGYRLVAREILGDGTGRGEEAGQMGVEQMLE